MVLCVGAWCMSTWVCCGSSFKFPKKWAAQDNVSQRNGLKRNCTTLYGQTKATFVLLGLDSTDSWPQTLNLSLNIFVSMASNSSVYGNVRKFSGVGRIYHMSGIMNQSEDTEILQEVILACVRKENTWKGWLNKNTSQNISGKGFSFQNKKINIMHIPAQCSELSSLQIFCFNIKHAVSEAKPKTVGELVERKLDFLLTGALDSVQHRGVAFLRNSGHAPK